MTTDWDNPIRNLLPGDIFHADGSGGASLICLVTNVGGDIIEARTVTTNVQIRFDRATRKSLWSSSGVSGLIDSVAPLPVDIHNVMLGIDRKYRLDRNLDRLKLNDSEKNALLFVYDYYRENPI